VEIFKVNKITEKSIEIIIVPFFVGNGNIDNYLVAVVTAIIRFIFSLVSCVLLLKMGRRALGIVSALGTSLASLILAGYLIARKEGSSVDVSICLFVLN